MHVKEKTGGFVVIGSHFKPFEAVKSAAAWVSKLLSAAAASRLKPARLASLAWVRVRKRRKLRRITSECVCAGVLDKEQSKDKN